MNGKRGIAILPFTDMSPQKDQEYFCDGLAEELIHALGKVDGLHVVPRTSSFRFRTTDLGIREVGKQLNVDCVVEGSIRKSGEKLRIVLNLIQVEDESPIWSARYDRNLVDVFEIQDEISKEIVQKLTVSIVAPETVAEPVAEPVVEPKPEPVVEPEPEPPAIKNIQAYENYLRARHEWNRRTEESLKQCVDLFKAAIAEDSEYALAYAGLADAYVTLAIYGALPPADVMPLAKESALKALELNPGLSEALSALACVQAIFEWNWDEAIRGFQRAIESNPKNAAARQWFAINGLAPLGRFTEAREQIEIARKMDPDSTVIRITDAALAYFERDFNKAVLTCSELLNGTPDFAIAHYFMGQAFLGLNRHQEAVAELTKAVDLSHRSAETIAMLAYAHFMNGQKLEAIQLSLELTRRSIQTYISPVLQAQLGVGMGDPVHVFTYLEDAYRARASDLIWIGIRPSMDSVRSDPRMQDLCRRVGIR